MATRRIAHANGPGSDYPIYDDLKKYVYDAGKGGRRRLSMPRRPCCTTGACMAALLAVEAAKTAQEIHGVADKPNAQRQ